MLIQACFRICCAKRVLGCIAPVLSVFSSSPHWGSLPPHTHPGPLVKPCNSNWDLNLWSLNWDHTWSQDLMKLRWMLHSRKNSVGNKVTGMKWISFERNTQVAKRWTQLKQLSTHACTLHRVWAISEGKSGDFSRNWATTHCGHFIFDLGTIMGPAVVSFNLLMCHNEHILRLKFQWKSCPPWWT